MIRTPGLPLAGAGCSPQDVIIRGGEGGPLAGDLRLNLWFTSCSVTGRWPRDIARPPYLDRTGGLWSRTHTWYRTAGPLAFIFEFSSVKPNEVRLISQCSAKHLWALGPKWGSLAVSDRPPSLSSKEKMCLHRELKSPVSPASAAGLAPGCLLLPSALPWLLSVPVGSSTWAESAYEILVGTESVSSQCFQIGVLGCL